MSDTWRVSKLDVNIRYEGNIPVIEARGECDLITSRKIREAAESLVNSGHCTMIFDLRDMSYIDSSGFRVLLDAKNMAVGKAGDIALVSMTAPVERVFNLLRLDEILIRTDTVEESVQKLKDMQCK